VLVIVQQGLVDFFRYRFLVPIGCRIVQILRQAGAKRPIQCQPQVPLTFFLIHSIDLARVLDWPHCFLAAMIAMCCGEWWLSFTRFFIQFVEPAYINDSSPHVLFPLGIGFQVFLGGWVGSFANHLSCENWSEMFKSLLFLRENYVSVHRKPFDLHFTDLISF
jgi:hypothetical protein